MPIYRIIPALIPLVILTASAAAQTPAPAPTPAPAAAKPTAPPTKAEVRLDEAIAKLKRLKSVSAELAQTVEMLGQKFRLTGKYLKAPGYRVYLILELSGLGDAAGTMLQVCDGTTLWDFNKVLGTPSVRKLVIAGILKKLDSSELDADIRARMIAQLGFAGPEALLVGLRKAMTFNQMAEGQLDGQAVWIIRGEWKDYEGLGTPGQVIPPTAQLPPYVPKLGVVYLSKETLWPLKIELQGQALSVMIDDRPTDTYGHKIGPKAQARREPPSRIVLVYSNVELDAPIPASSFAFTPPQDIQVIDGTARMEAELEALIEDQKNRKNAEAAKAAEKGTEPLPQGINVPSTPGAGAPDTFRSTAPPPEGKQP